MDIKHRGEFERLISQAMQQDFSGWDFGFLRDRWKSNPTTWDYAQIARQHIQPAISLLDMDTGGGEFLSSLQPLPHTTYATEAYAPNVPIARQRLEPLGVHIVDMTEKGHTLPFPNDSFDLILNRHGSFAATEIHRALKPNGIFITQQVGRENNFEINMLLQEHPECLYSGWTLGVAAEQLSSAGLAILDQREEFPEGKVLDIGALVYYLKVIPWQIVDFSIEKYYAKLAQVHNLIQEYGGFTTREHRFLIVARKP